jgi:hypothetical protein
MSNISPQKNARTPEQNISLRNLCKNFWLEETAILDMQMSKLPMISGYAWHGVQSSNKLLAWECKVRSNKLLAMECKVDKTPGMECKMFINHSIISYKSTNSWHGVQK